MTLWPALLVLALLLHLADRAFGFGYILSAIALIVFGMSIASALGYSVPDQEPYVAVIAPLVLLSPIVRAVYSSRFASRSQPPDSGLVVDERDRNAQSAINWLTAGASHLMDFTFYVVLLSMVLFVAYLILANPPPPSEYGTALLVGGGFIGTHLSSKRTESNLWRVFLGMSAGIVVGGLLFAGALVARLYREGIIALPSF